MRSTNRVPLWVYLAIAFIVLQLLDGIFTCVGVYLYGLDLEGNPVAAFTFSKLGVYQSVIAFKAFSFIVFFGSLWYFISVRWSTLDIIGLLWKRKPKRSKTYAMVCFYVVGGVTILASLYAGAGWIYILFLLGQTR